MFNLGAHGFNIESVSPKIKHRTLCNAGFYQYSTREGIHIVCEAYDTFYKDTPPIPTVYLTSAQANITGELVPVLYQIDI